MDLGLPSTIYIPHSDSEDDGDSDHEENQDSDSELPFTGHIPYLAPPASNEDNSDTSRADDADDEDEETDHADEVDQGADGSPVSFNPSSHWAGFDPGSGQFTAQSFGNFRDEWLE